MKSDNNWARLSAWTAGLALYAGLLYWVLSSSVSTFYGFPVKPGLHDLLIAASQGAPFLAALFLLALESSARKICGPILHAPALAATFMAATVSVLLIINRGASDGLPAAVQAWSYAGLFADFLLTAFFLSWIRWLAGGPVLAYLLFFAYCAVVFYAAPKWELTAFIGFGSTPPTALTLYSTRPLGLFDAWLFRLYWALCAVLMAAIRYDASRRFRKPIAVTAAAACFVAAAVTVWKHTHPPAPAAVEVGAAESDVRPQLTDYQLDLLYKPGERRISIKGSLEFLNRASAPIQTVWIEAPKAVVPGQIRYSRQAQSQALGAYQRVQFAEPIGAGETFRVEYDGEIRADGKQARAKLLDSSFFLYHTDLLFAARKAGCLDGAASNCSEGKPAENYLLTDYASGRLTVEVPPGWDAVSVGDKSVENGRITFKRANPRLVSFLVACAPFSESAVSDVHVFHPRNQRLNGAATGRMARRILDFYERMFPALETRELRVVVTPGDLGEAIAFEGLLAISEWVINSRAADGSSSSDIAEFVMAHELAHQWWGYGLTPTRSPGRAFVLESFAQFAAYQYMAERNILSPANARENERRNYIAASKRIRGGLQERPLSEIEEGDYLAYHKGPYALLTLDEQPGHPVLNWMGDILRRRASTRQESVTPASVINDLLERMPPAIQDKARKSLMDTRTARSGGPPTKATPSELSLGREHEMK